MNEKDIISFSPEQLASRWQCSASTVRNLIHGGKLRSIRVGAKLIRIPAQAVREFEECQ